MQIEDGWTHSDLVTGLTLTAVKGERLNRLHIEGVAGCPPRDFFFTADGEFDGTGSCLLPDPNEPKCPTAEES